jgi:hypothetical protein
LTKNEGIELDTLSSAGTPADADNASEEFSNSRVRDV